MLWIQDNTYFAHLLIGADKIIVQGAYWGEYSLDSTDEFHTYRIAGKDRTLKVFVDDLMVMDLVVSRSVGGTNVLSFGDGSVSDGRTITQWDFFRFTTNPIPEPSTLLLIGSASAVVLGFRRHRHSI
jgi:hypothetical protein